MPLTFKPATRYLVRTGVTAQQPNGTLRDMVVAEVSASGEFVRVVWEASPDGIALPVIQEWLPAAEVNAMLIEELATPKGQAPRAASMPGYPRSLGINGMPVPPRQ